jgi:hypothetical protein
MSNKINFKSLNILISEKVNEYSLEIQTEIYQYLSQLNECEKKAYLIAFSHLESSFDIQRSNGFLEWKQKKIK